jgi:hypothetical protein
MKNLEASVGFHRRKKGLYKSKVGDQHGVFDFKIRPNRYCQERVIVCIASSDDVSDCVEVSIREKDCGVLRVREPLPCEITRIRNLFFTPEEIVIQIHRPNQKKENPIKLFSLKPPYTLARLNNKLKNEIKNQKSH